MLIVLTGLQPTLWFADARGSAIGTYRKFLFARVVHAGKPLFCPMCVITRVSPDRNWLIDAHITFHVRELGFGLTPSWPRQDAASTPFGTVRDAQLYAITLAWQVLAQQQTRELLLHFDDMYNEVHYKNWEPVCL